MDVWTGGRANIVDENKQGIRPRALGEGRLEECERVAELKKNEEQVLETEQIDYVINDPPMIPPPSASTLLQRSTFNLVWYATMTALLLRSRRLPNRS